MIAILICFVLSSLSSITIDDIEDANPSFADLEMLSFMIDDEDE